MDADFFCNFNKRGRRPKTAKCCLTLTYQGPRPPFFLHQIFPIISWIFSYFEISSQQNLKYSLRNSKSNANRQGMRFLIVSSKLTLHLIRYFHFQEVILKGITETLHSPKFLGWGGSNVVGIICSTRLEYWKLIDQKPAYLHQRGQWGLPLQCAWYQLVQLTKHMLLFCSATLEGCRKEHDAVRQSCKDVIQDAGRQASLDERWL